jgi:hypothetical protein
VKGPIWRVVISGYATLTEIQTSWSIEDMADALEVLDYLDAVHKEQNEKAQ